MPIWNKKQDEGIAAVESQEKRPKPPQVIVNVQKMDEQQAHRLTTAVDALLAELVRQELGRSGSK